MFSYAFIRGAGFDDALPQVDRRAPPLVVGSEDELVIELNDYVVSAGGRVRLTDASSVQATHANGDDLVLDADTLVFTSADTYFEAGVHLVRGGRLGGPQRRHRAAHHGAPARQPAADVHRRRAQFEPGQERVISNT